MKKAGRKTLSIMLVALMVISIVPMSMFEGHAATEDKAIMLGTGGVDVVDKTNVSGSDKLVYGTFNNGTTDYPVTWLKLSEGGLMLSEHILEETMFESMDSGYYYSWDYNTLQTLMGNYYSLYDGSTGRLGLSANEQAAVASTTLAASSMASSATELTEQKFFPLSSEEVSTYIGTDFSTDLAKNFTSIDGKSYEAWWTRTSYNNQAKQPIRVLRTEMSSYFNREYQGSRPAFNVKESEVVLTTAAVGGKTDAVDSTLSAVGSGSGITEWKMTVEAPSGRYLSFRTTPNVTIENNVVSFEYNGAIVGANEYISVMLVDDDDNVLYYGKLKNVDSAAGSASFDLPAGYTTGDKINLRIFNEQINGDNETDISSNVLSKTLYVPNPVEDKDEMMLGIGSINAVNVNNHADNDSIAFGEYNGNPAEWYDLSGEGFLLSRYTMGASAFNSSETKAYPGSSLYMHLLTMYMTGLGLTEAEKAVIADTTLTKESMNPDDAALPDATGQKLFPLSVDEFNTYIGTGSDLAISITSNDWWTRTSADHYFEENDVISTASGPFGKISSAWANTGGYIYARPAFNIDESQVLFTSAANAYPKGKTDAVDSNLSKMGSGNDISVWKLTVKDDTRNFALNGQPTVENGVISFDYTGATVGANEHVSAMIVDDSGKIAYYGKLVNTTASGSGSASITIPSEYSIGDTINLKIFNEQINGDKVSDIGSAFVEESITLSGTAFKNDAMVMGTDAIEPWDKDSTAGDVDSVSKIILGSIDNSGTSYSIPWVMINDSGLMLSEYLLEQAKFRESFGRDEGYYGPSSGDPTSNSNLKEIMESYYNSAFGLSSAEKTLIKGTTLTSNSMSAEVLELTDQKFFPLSTLEVTDYVGNGSALATSPDYIYGGGLTYTSWWTRTTHTTTTTAYGITSNGEHSNYNAYSYELGVRPAFTLDTSKVLFTSAATSGKTDAVDNTLTEIVTDNITNWKVTALDEARTFDVTGEPTIDSDTVEFNYTGASTGANEYVSVMIVDDSDKILYYGKVKSASAASGSASFDLPSEFSGGDTLNLRIFNEQINGDNVTDVSSAFVEKSVVMTETDAEAVARAKGLINDGMVLVAYSKQTQAEKTAAVQTYVDVIIANATPTTGVGAVVTYSADNTYTVALSKGSVNDTKNIEMDVTVAAETNAEKLARAKSLLTGGTINIAYSKQSQDDKTAAVQDYVDDFLAGITPTTDVTATVSHDVDDSYFVILRVGLTSDAKTIDMVINVLPETNTEALARAQSALVDGEVDMPYSQQTQAHKTAAVQAYVNNILANLDPTTGVSGTVRHTSGNIYTVDLNKDGNVAVHTITMTHFLLGETDDESIDRAMSLVNEGEIDIAYSKQSDADKEDAVQAYVDDIINNIDPTTGVSVTVTHDFADVFSVRFSKGIDNDTKNLNMTFNVLDETDAEAVARAKGLVVGGGVDVAYSQNTQAGKLAAVQTYVDGLLAGTGVSGTVVHKSGDTYTVTLSKGSAPDLTTDTKDIDMTVNVAGETNAEAVARIKGLIVDGEVDLAYSKQTQADKTAAVQDYVDSITSGSGVSGVVTFTSGNTYSVALKLGSESDTKSIDMTYKELPETDVEAVARAKALIVGGSVDIAYSKQTQADKTDAVQTYIDDFLADIDPTTGVGAVVTYSADNTYTVALSKGSANDTTNIDMVINVLDETDTEAVARAKDSLVGGDVNVYHSSQTQADKTDAVQTYVDDFLADIDPSTGVSGVVTFDTGDTYSVALSKGSASDTDDIVMNVIVLAETEAEAVARIKGLIVDGEVDLAYSKQTQADKTAAVQDYVDSITSGSGVSGVVTFTSGNTYSVALKLGSESDTKSIDMTYKELPETDVEAVARAKALIVGGSVDIAYSKQTQADKTDAVQTYIDDFLADIDPTTGVGAVVTYSADNTYTVALSKGSANDTTNIDMVINVLDETDTEAVERVKSLVVGGGVDVAYSQNTEAGKLAAVKTYVDGLLTGTGVSGTVTFNTGNTYSVVIKKGSASDTVDIDMIINVLAETDAEKVARAEGLIVGGTVSVAYSEQTQTDKTAAVQDYVNDILSKESPDTGVTGTVTYKSGSTYTVALNKDGTSGSKNITMTVNILPETDREAINRAMELIKDGEVSVDYENQTEADKVAAVESYVRGLVKDTGVDIGVVYNPVLGKYTVAVSKGGFADTKSLTMKITVYYETLEGDNQVITQATNAPLTFKTEGEIDAFLNLYLNGKLVDKANYTTESGSVIFTVTSEYIKSLPVGEHVFVAEFIDGSATINLEVGSASEVTGTGSNKNPETGDNSNIMLFLGAMIISLGGIGTVVYRKKRAK